MKEISIVGIDISFEICEETKDFLILLQEICEEFHLEIIGLWPMGPGGGWPEVTFRGETENIHKMIKDWYMKEDEESEEWIKEYVTEYEETEFNVKIDSRFERKERKFINKN